MKVWLTTVVLLFILVEAFQWLKQFMLPMPLYIIGGAVLAIASNYEKGITSFFPSPKDIQTATLDPLVKNLETKDNTKTLEIPPSTEN